MTKTETVLRSIFGSCRSDIRPLAYAVDIAIDLMFVQCIPMDDIMVTNDIYPDVAKRIRKKSGAHPSAKSASRRIERLANKCWDAMVSRDLVVKYIGAPLEDIRAPRDVIFYLAFYSYLSTPFFTAIERQPALLF